VVSSSTLRSSTAICAAVVIVVAWATFRQLPTTTASAGTAATQPVAHLQEVRSISFDGRRLPLARLREVLATRPGEPLDPRRLERDRDAMERQLAGLGFLAARVEPAVVTFDAAGAAYITFEIDQGKLFHLRNIAVTGAGKDAAVVTLAAGDDAIRDRIEHARDALAEALARRGKPAAVQLSVHTDIAGAAVDVALATR
jgi:outer membrane protein assembly factor BamA